MLLKINSNQIKKTYNVLTNKLVNITILNNKLIIKFNPTQLDILKTLDKNNIKYSFK